MRKDTIMVADHRIYTSKEGSETGEEVKKTERKNEWGQRTRGTDGITELKGPI